MPDILVPDYPTRAGVSPEVWSRCQALMGTNSFGQDQALAEVISMVTREDRATLAEVGRRAEPLAAFAEGMIQLLGRLQPDLVAIIEERALAARPDQERFRWLCSDPEAQEEREAIYECTSNFPVRSYAANCAMVDAHMERFGRKTW